MHQGAIHVRQNSRQGLIEMYQRVLRPLTQRRRPGRSWALRSTHEPACAGLDPKQLQEAQLHIAGLLFAAGCARPSAEVLGEYHVVCAGPVEKAQQARSEGLG